MPEDVLIIGGKITRRGRRATRTCISSRWSAGPFTLPDLRRRRPMGGQVLEPVDYIAFIGRNPGDRHVYIATGDSGNGITHGAIAGCSSGISSPASTTRGPTCSIRRASRALGLDLDRRERERRAAVHGSRHAR